MIKKIITIIIIIKIIIVTRPFYETCVNWVVDPTQPASRRPVLEESSAPKIPPSG